MKFMARRAYLLSFCFLLPVLFSLKGARIGERIEYGLTDTIIESKKLVETVPEKKPFVALSSPADSMIRVIYNLQKQTNGKLDTGLSRQLNYIKSQNFLAMKVLEMNETIQTLKTKTNVPAQVYKEAKDGRTQKEIFRLLVLILGGVLVLIGAVGSIIITMHKSRLSQKKSPI